MQSKALGKSGLRVSELSLGTMLFGEDSRRSTPESDASQIIDTFLGEGGTHIDTANAYAGGESERIIGRALKHRRDQVTLASKVRFGGQPSELAAPLSRIRVLNEVDASLARLQTDYLDLLYLHGWDPETPIEETLAACTQLVQSGKVRYLGVSNFKAWQLMKACSLSAVPIIAGQYQYSLVVRDIESEYQSLMLDQGIGLMAWGPLGGGFLSGKYQPGDKPSEGRIAESGDDVEESWSLRATEANFNTLRVIRDIADQRRATLSQVALAWLMHRDWVSSVIIGPRTLTQLQDNLKAREVHLSADEIEALDSASARNPGYPYRMIRQYGME